MSDYTAYTAIVACLNVRPQGSYLSGQKVYLRKAAPVTSTS